ncbi:calcium/sodium antiporter [Stappia taiwanensis]|uniref:Calcium/sodium antiporter n=1 Tax=Stappia taiwanensis TaxID=992267 RepID=A0A838XWI3_9HYPH|nr:calcium/sodium antiporter [Stappia taiwanensis]MBA4611190.1 calcium/sodium antiporter [Stappia taiwanensis]GGE86668.1 sodium:calcium antiporter [Stappia taiwanensis]
MLIDYVSLIGGLVVLVVAGDVLVRGAVGIAERLGIPALVIGLTIVAFGTSAPELVISLGAAMDGLPGIAIGNVVGSNIANVLLVLGLPAIIAVTSCRETGAIRNSAFMVLITVVFIAMCFHSPISRLDGIVLLLLLGLFLWDSVRATRKHRRENGHCADKSTDAECPEEDAKEEEAGELFEEVEGVPESPALAILFIVLGLIGLPLGAHFTIAGASALASAWGVTEAVIGLTVVALGTSLPELATSLMAAIRGHSAVALGNVIGSNVFNLLAIMGITAVVVPLGVPAEVLVLDLWVMLASALLVLAFAAMHVTIRRPSGAILSLLYCLYIFVVFQFGQVG